MGFLARLFVLATALLAVSSAPAFANGTLTATIDGLGTVGGGLDCARVSLTVAPDCSKAFTDRCVSPAKAESVTTGPSVIVDPPIIIGPPIIPCHFVPAH